MGTVNCCSLFGIRRWNWGGETKFKANGHNPPQRKGAKELNETSLKNPAPSCSWTKVLSTEPLFLLWNIISSSKRYQVKFPMSAPKYGNFECMALLAELHSVRLVLSAGADRNDWQDELATVSSLLYSFFSSSLFLLSSFGSFHLPRCPLSTAPLSSVIGNAHSLQWVVAFSYMPSNALSLSSFLAYFLT